ncbi:hypothetical protein CALVIDRAFT_600225 [Calocera viscosa TUFC12733]|uniref:F-box domain-containing protein n=1 Tax=Calocera viscosa (strain TUFC12733) TaxID=1330018 RepID=A0A167JWB4_CALVF|nr:hypothetical protein CALVIDRAFT_600225 [Calocera viscosa TUFC12733]
MPIPMHGMRSSTSLASINELPNELLCLIFELAHETALLDFRRFFRHDKLTWTTAGTLLSLIWTLSSVSRRWRNLVHSMPSWWTVIPLIDWLHSPWTLEDFAKLSANRPLTLVTNVVDDKLRVRLNSLQTSEVLPRIHTVWIAAPSSARYDEEELSRVRDLVESLALPGLQHVVLHWLLICLDIEWVRNWVAVLARQLVSIQLYNTDLWPLHHHQSLPTMSFPRLDKLTFSRYYECVTSLLVHGVFPSLTELHLGLTLTTEVSSRTMPALRLLTMSAGREDSYRLPFVFLDAAPRLERVEFASRDDFCKELLLYRFHLGHQVPFVQAINAPSLKCLALRGGTLRLSALQKINEHRSALVAPPHDWDIKLEYVRLESDDEKPLPVWWAEQEECMLEEARLAR